MRLLVVVVLTSTLPPFAAGSGGSCCLALPLLLPAPSSAGAVSVVARSSASKASLSRSTRSSCRGAAAPRRSQLAVQSAMHQAGRPGGEAPCSHFWPSSFSFFSIQSPPRTAE